MTHPEMGVPKCIPGATARLQCRREFDFASASAVVSYLKSLGVTHVYLSPPFRAVAGSPHGYNVCAFGELNPELGGTDGFQALTRALKENSLGLIVDMVPNHMGNDLSNPWWRNVLEYGPASPYARWFDIDWRPRSGDLRDKVLLPVLEDHYASVLEAGKLQLKYESGTFTICYHDRGFPVSSGSWAFILEAVRAEADVQGLREITQELPALAQAAEEVPDPVPCEAFERLKQRLASWYESSESLRKTIKPALTSLNGTHGDPRSFDKLHRLLSAQHYRLAHWKVGPAEINYRRFFDITDLISLRMELPDVFSATHKLVFDLIAAGDVAGLRIDHPDGLRNPKQYFDALQEQARARGLEGLYVVAEKILSGEEQLPEDWKVDGTTGYDFLIRLNGLFVDSRNAGAMDDIYRDFAGPASDYQTQVYLGKKRILEQSLASELRALSHRLKDACLHTRYGQDFPFETLRACVTELIACFPVYRTYITEQTAAPTAVEAVQIREAVAEAKVRAPGLDAAALDFIASLLMLDFPGDMADQTEAREFVMRFQQLSGPAMAKGLEDTAFYNYFRLISLNEVGGEPGRFGLELEEYHQHCQERASRHPHGLLATATHDTKRGEDARTRISVLSEMPEAWAKAVKGWSRIAKNFRGAAQGRNAPDANDEYLFYQALAGAWTVAAVEDPAARTHLKERVGGFMLKAIRESKHHTTWTEPNEAYEAAMEQFVKAAFDSEEFLRSFAEFHLPLAWFGAIHSLSQVLVKTGAPGVPDFYQGTEFWDFSLVDPDNRRPVDYEARRKKLAVLETDFKARVVAGGKSPLESVLRQGPQPSEDLKMLVTWKALQTRRACPDLFEKGSYEPLRVTGTNARHVIAFARRLNDTLAVFIAPRLCFGLMKGRMRWPVGPEIWGDAAVYLPTAFPPLVDVFSGHECAPDQEGKLRLGRTLSAFPLALLVTPLSV